VVEYKHIKRWAMPECYFGEVWPDYYSAGVGQSRDSSALERSNFAIMLRDLGGGSESVIVVRERHWAVAWVEWIAIHESATDKLAIAEKNCAAIEEYPILSEDHFSELESEEADSVWANCYDDASRIQYIREYRNQFEFRNFADMLACARGKYFAGWAGELLH